MFSILAFAKDDDLLPTRPPMFSKTNKQLNINLHKLKKSSINNLNYYCSVRSVQEI